jgi:hypothetical protein
MIAAIKEILADGSGAGWCGGRVNLRKKRPAINKEGSSGAAT